MRNSGFALVLSLLMSVFAAVAPAGAAPPAAPPAPDFALPALQGGNVRLSEYRGQVVVLTFWSSRCSSCAEQLSQLSEQQRLYGPAGLVTLAVSIDSDLARARNYAQDLVQSHKVRVPLLLDVGRAVGRIYGIDRLPTIVLIDRSGRVRQLFRDYRRTDNSYISQLRALLDDSVLSQVPENEAGPHS